MNTSEQKWNWKFIKILIKTYLIFLKTGDTILIDQKQNLKFTLNKKINIDEIFDIYKSMTKIKNIKLQFSKFNYKT